MGKVNYMKKKNEYFLKCDGDFYKGIFEGYGKLYKKYYKGEYYEGNFINGIIFGNGIKFYTNGQKKLEGYFEPSNNILKENIIVLKEILFIKVQLKITFFIILIFLKYIIMMDICYIKVKLKIKKKYQIIFNY